MKKNKWVLPITIFVFVMSLTIVSLTALFVKKSIADNIFVVSFYNNNEAFSNKDIEFLTQEHYYFTFAARMETEVATETTASQMEIVGTNDNFASINKLNAVAGSFFNDIHLKKHSNVTVLNNAAAWYLFGNSNCVGNSVSINGNMYQVIGVYEKSFLQDDDKLIYVPYDNIENYQTASGIYEILVAAESLSHLDTLVMNMGYRTGNIRIIDLEQYKDIMMQRVRIIVFLVGIYTVACCFISGLNHTRTIVQEVRSFYRDNYVTDTLLLLKEKSIFFEFYLLGRNVILAILTINIIKFKLRLPYYFFSLNSINYTVMEDLLNFFMLPYISFPALEYTNGLNAVSNFTFFSSLLFGVVIMLRRRVQ